MELQGESFKKLLDLANAYRESQEENNNLKEKIHQLEERMKELEKKEKRKMLFHSLANRSNTVLADETQSQSDIKGQSYKMYFPL
jgi:cell division septum initiation protein DivIVA